MVATGRNPGNDPRLGNPLANHFRSQIHPWPASIQDGRIGGHNPVFCSKQRIDAVGKLDGHWNVP